MAAWRPVRRTSAQRSTTGLAPVGSHSERTLEGVRPACERGFADYGVIAGAQDDLAQLLPSLGGVRRGAASSAVPDGTRREIYTGRLTVVLFGDDRGRLDRAVEQLRREPTGPPRLPDPLITASGLLPAAAAGSLDGTLTCDA